MRLKYNDKHHSYWLDGKRCKGVTTIAKIPDDTYRLEAWTARQVAIGMAKSPELVESVAAHFDDYQKVTEAVDDAKKAAGAGIGSSRGTSLHRITERIDLNEEIVPTPLSAYVVASWQAALDAADLEVLPDFVERAVVYPDRLIAGRFDRILRRRSDGRLFIGDVKGGARAIEYPHSMACQLAMYANAPLICGQWGGGDGETEQFDPMPDVDKDWGYIFHLPESGEPAVAKVDIAGGWDITTQAIFPILDWRARRDLCQPVAQIGGGEPAPVVPPAVEQAPPAVPRRTFGDELRARTTVAPIEKEATADPVAVMALQRRFDKLDGDAKAWVDAIVADAKAAGHQLNLSGRAAAPTVRQFEIGRALVRFATLDPDDRLLRAALELVVGRRRQVAVSLGALVGILTIPELETLNGIALAIHNGQRTVVYTTDSAQLDAA